MTEQQAFQEHLRRHADDDTARLVFADWLDEHGNNPLAAARIRWWVAAKQKVAGGPTSGSGAMSHTPAGAQERAGLPEWAARLNQVKGVRDALAGTPSVKHAGMQDALHDAEMHAYGLTSRDDIEHARMRAQGLNYAHIGTHNYDAAQGLLRRDAHQEYLYPPRWAQWAHGEALGRGARDAAHDKHQRDTQLLVEHARNNPPPTHEADAVRLARPLGWLKDKVSSWFSKPAPRDSRDGIFHTHADNPTAVYAEKNAVAQALRLLGAGDRVDPAKVDRYTSHVARFVKDNPNHDVVKQYLEKAKVIGGTAGPELTAAVKPLVGVANLLLAAHGMDERFKKPESEGAPRPSPRTSPAEPGAPPTEEAPIALDPVPPTENTHALVHRLLQEHKDLGKVKAVLKGEHGLSHQEAHEATRAFLALHTGMKGFKAFQKKARKDPDAKLAKPKPGEKVAPKHTLNVAYASKPINTALAGTALAYHLRQIGQDHPELAPLVDRALARESVPGSAGADAYARIGVRLKQKSDPRATLFNWHTLHDSLIQDAKVRALIQQHIVKGHGVEGESPLAAERRYWDSVHRGLGQGKAGNAEQAWARIVKNREGLTREQITQSIARLKDRALDREYTSLKDPDWRDVMGAAPEGHAKYQRVQW